MIPMNDFAFEPAELSRHELAAVKGASWTAAGFPLLLIMKLAETWFDLR